MAIQHALDMAPLEMQCLIGSELKGKVSLGCQYVALLCVAWVSHSRVSPFPAVLFVIQVLLQPAYAWKLRHAEDHSNPTAIGPYVHHARAEGLLPTPGFVG